MKNMKTKKTIGEKIDEEVEWIINTTEEIFKRKDHVLWRNSKAKIADLLLVDQRMAIFKAEEIIRKVEDYKGNKEE